MNIANETAIRKQVALVRNAFRDVPDSDDTTAVESYGFSMLMKSRHSSDGQPLCRAERLIQRKPNRLVEGIVSKGLFVYVFCLGDLPRAVVVS